VKLSETRHEGGGKILLTLAVAVGCFGVATDC